MLDDDTDDPPSAAATTKWWHTAVRLPIVLALLTGLGMSCGGAGPTVNERRMAALHSDPVLHAIPTKSFLRHTFETPFGDDGEPVAALDLSQSATTSLTPAQFVASYVTYLERHGWAWIRVDCRSRFVSLHSYRNYGSLYRSFDVLAQNDGTATMSLETARHDDSLPGGEGSLRPAGTKTTTIDPSCPSPLPGE